MGISKRNPRGNFNWQSRILKKKAQCCGQLNEPVDCGALAPIISLSGYVLCDNGLPFTITATNTQPSQTTTWEWYFNGVQISATNSYTWNPLLPGDQGTYTIIATNEYGCVTELEVYFTYVAEPILVVAVSDPTPPACDGALILTVTNPTVGVDYKYDLINPATNTVISTVTTSSFSNTFSSLCLGQYAYRVTPVVTTPYGVFTTCGTVPVIQNVPTPVGPAFTLEYSDLNTLNIGGPFNYYNVATWNTIMGSNYQICVVDSGLNRIYFYYTAGSLVMNIDAFRSGIHQDLIIVKDSPGDFVTLMDGVFYGRQNLLAADFPAVTITGGSIFSDCYSLTSVSIPLLTYVEASSFYNCPALDNPDIPNVTYINASAFSLCSSLTQTNSAGKIYFANLTGMFGGSNFFNCTSIIDVDLPVCTQIFASTFRGCTSLSTFDAPLLTTMTSSNFTGMTGLNLTLINIPSLVPVNPFQCANNDGNFQTANGVPYDPASNFVLNIANASCTCNAGSPDGDLVWLQTLNPLVTINCI